MTGSSVGRDILIQVLVLVIIANVAVIALAFGGWRHQRTARPSTAEAAPQPEAGREQRRDGSGHPATFVALELVGPGLPLAAHASDAAVRLERSATVILTRMTRRGDHFGRDGRGAFRVMLAETDEAAAQAYVRRVARDLEPRLLALGGSFRIGAGWASPRSTSDLSAALRLAEARLSAVIDQQQGASL